MTVPCQVAFMGSPRGYRLRPVGQDLGQPHLARTCSTDSTGRDAGLPGQTLQAEGSRVEFPRRWVARRPCDPPPTGRSMSTWPRVGVHRPLRRSRAQLCPQWSDVRGGAAIPTSGGAGTTMPLTDSGHPGRRRTPEVTRAGELLGRTGRESSWLSCAGGEVPLDRGATTRGRDDPQLAAGCPDPVAHAGQAVGGAHRARVEPVPVVGDAEPQPTARPLVV